LIFSCLKAPDTEHEIAYAKRSREQIAIVSGWIQRHSIVDYCRMSFRRHSFDVVSFSPS